MVTKRKEFFGILLLLLFVSTILSINFLHSETTISGDDDCPACHFQNSSITTCQINTFFLPQPSFSGILKTIEFFHYAYLYTIDPNSRGPPQI